MFPWQRAIDLNPLLNPCIYASGAFQPQNAAAYPGPQPHRPGGDPAVHIFTDHGWRWGGYWATPIDYQHFERP
ncbi:MAG: M15 family metallopeptidase [Mycobacterium sp.]|uniref:M15 family metallopeptidase n=1 Tax=Mycobacterium sp. TaxID=1785 RepID=UPI003F94A6D3